MHMLYAEFLKGFQLKPELVPLFQKVIKLELGHFNEEQDKEVKTIKANKTEIENKIKKVQVRLGLGEISKEIYDTTIGALQTELYKINTQLNSYSKKLSNIDKIANSISTTSCKLAGLWNNGNYQDKVKLQKLVFPEGVLWDKVNESFRTLKINRVFDVIHSLTDNYNDKKERSDNEIYPLSHLVEERRLERPTPTSRTWCATNCATPRNPQRYALLCTYRYTVPLSHVPGA